MPFGDEADRFGGILPARAVGREKSVVSVESAVARPAQTVWPGMKFRAAGGQRPELAPVGRDD